jgi:hypothetical protein
MLLKDLIEVADTGYDQEGLVTAYYETPAGNFGDGLAKFIADELTDTYDSDGSDPEILETAIDVMQSAYDQLGDVVRALEAKLR